MLASQAAALMNGGKGCWLRCGQCTGRNRGGICRSRYAGTGGNRVDRRGDGIGAADALPRRRARLRSADLEAIQGQVARSQAFNCC